MYRLRLRSNTESGTVPHPRTEPAMQAAGVEAEQVATITIKHRHTGAVLYAHETTEDRIGIGLAMKDATDAALKARADLRGADLRDADLSGADLRGAYLIGADLRDADLSGADLSDADLIGADLRGAYLSGAHLIGADLSDAYLRSEEHTSELQSTKDIVCRL